MLPEQEATPSNSLSIFEHIGELRTKIFISLGAVILGSVVAHYFHQHVIRFILRPVGSQELLFLSPLEPLFFILKIDLLIGFLLALPIINWAFFSYIRPALQKSTHIMLIVAYIVSALLVIGAVCYAYFVTIPISLKFLSLIVIPGIQNTITAGSYLVFFLAQAAVVAIIFQIPVFVITGIYLKIWSTKSLGAKRRFVYLVGTIALAVLTPTTDIFNLGIMLVPALVIFEGSLIVGKIFETVRKKSKVN
ncbi:MAG: twin-arginine translocase subunit TatC [Patescibacteria group bacterium]